MNELAVRIVFEGGSDRAFAAESLLADRSSQGTCLFGRSLL
jgi:hypothetical protein